MTTQMALTSADLEVLPEHGKRYEIIGGELYVSKQPDWHHQYACLKLGAALQVWSEQNHSGMANIAPGVIFADDDDVAPDVVWVSTERLRTALATDGKLHAAPDLVIEVLSPGGATTRRDRETKLKLSSRRGVYEYWIIDWRQRLVEIYRRDQARLVLRSTLSAHDTITAPMLPGFACAVTTLFFDLPGPPQATTTPDT